LGLGKQSEARIWKALEGDPLIKQENTLSSRCPFTKWLEAIVFLAVRLKEHPSAVDFFQPARANHQRMMFP
jgi:hypothetical protein